MYWPLGAPRVYASSDGAAFLDQEDEGDTLDSTSQQHGEHILDLFVGRSQQLFVTISATCLCIWQVSVSHLSSLRLLLLTQS